MSMFIFLRSDGHDVCAGRVGGSRAALCDNRIVVQPLLSHAAKEFQPKAQLFLAQDPHRPRNPRPRRDLGRHRKRENYARNLPQQQLDIWFSDTPAEYRAPRPSLRDGSASSPIAWPQKSQPRRIVIQRGNGPCGGQMRYRAYRANRCREDY